MNTKTCFIITKYGSASSPVYKTLAEAIKSAKLRCLDLKNDNTPKVIMASIIRFIIEADVVIADISDPSPNVFYELGIAHAIGNKTIIISQNLKESPFDLQSQFALEYENTDKGLELLGWRLKDIFPKVLASGDTPSNPVQMFGEEFFDTNRKLGERLDQLNAEVERMTAFREYMEQGKRVNNAAVLNRISQIADDCRKGHERTTFVAICGAAGLGKTTLAQHLTGALKRLHPGLKVGTLPTDAFMLNRKKRIRNGWSGYDPRANELTALRDAIVKVRRGQSVNYRAYNHRTGKHETDETKIGPLDVLIVEGIHSLHPIVVNRMDLKIFLYAPKADTKELRFIADLFDRSYGARQAFERSEQEFQEFENHILYYMKLADIVVHVDKYWKYRFDE
jgi:uridine kinase